MSDRPIIFSAPMVSALLDGRKTQTRRVLKRTGYDLASCPRAALCDGGLIQFEHPRGGPFTCVRAPFAPDDRLWVRESFAQPYAPGNGHNGCIYRADGPEFLPGASAVHQWGAEAKWKPSIHMPRRCSRLTLAVTDVRIERLNEIRRADAIAEGCGSPLIGSEAPPPGRGVFRADERTSFAILWNKLHGPGSWAANPWVVAITFTVHKANIDAMENAA